MIQFPDEDEDKDKDENEQQQQQQQRVAYLPRSGVGVIGAACVGVQPGRSGMPSPPSSALCVPSASMPPSTGPAWTLDSTHYS